MNKYLISLNALENNRGSEALIRGLVDIIRTKDPDSFISVISSECDVNKKVNIPGVDKLVSRYSYKSNHSLKRYLAIILERLFHKDGGGSLLRFYHLKKLVSQANHIVVIGADNYDKTYGMAKMMRQTNVFFRKYSTGKMWLYDCSIEESHLTESVISDMMLFDGITVRESESEAALNASLVSKAIYYYPDPAFLMKPEPCFEQLFSREFVGINVSNLICSSRYGKSKEQIYKNYKCLIQFCLEELHLDVLLIPHVMGGADLSALRDIKCMFKDEDRVYLIDDESLTAPQIKYIISKCRFLVTARTHASIAAYSSCVPTLVLGYSIKSRGIAKDLFGVVDNYVVPVQSIDSEETLRTAFRWIVQNEETIKEQLNLILPKYLESVASTYSLFNKRQLVEIEDKCCGCKACSNICPKHCITYEMDRSGFMYPQVDDDKCINCGLCKSVCPMIDSKSDNTQSNHKYIAAYNKNENVLHKSSSGGVFASLCNYVISEKHGVVYGARKIPPFQIAHSRADNLIDCEAFYGSKYLQSDICSCYADCKDDLEEGRTVLFSGTPCQIAGLYKFLKKSYDNLLTVGVVCHGVPSKMIFDKFIMMKQKQKNSNVIDYQWRNKKHGWGPNHISLSYENGESELTTSLQNPYQKGFLNNCYLRPSCYSCKFASIPRFEDISLADFWGYDGILKQKNANKGISLVALSNSKAFAVWEIVSKDFESEEVTEAYAKSKSRHLWIHPVDNVDRRSLANKAQFLPFERIDRQYINKSMFGKVVFKIRTKTKH